MQPAGTYRRRGWRLWWLSALALILAVGCGPGHDDGPECEDDGDCPALEVCNRALPGTLCAPPGEQGDLCEEHEDCAPDLRCYGEFQYRHDAVCDAPGIYGYPCQQSHNCAQGFKCSLGASPHCISEKDEGQFCTADYQCDEGMLCIAGLCEPDTDVQESD